MKKLLLCVLFASGCGGDGGEELFTPKPECMGAAITPYAGTFPQVISKLAIGSVEDGFDLDNDGKPDNKLAAVSTLAQSAIDDSFEKFEILIPIEFFDFATVAKDDCVKFAIYLADFEPDPGCENGPVDGLACSPYTADAELALDPLSLMNGAPVISFWDGTVDAANKLSAGPSIFSVNIPVTNGITLDLRITGATIEATLGADGTTMTGRLGGVIDARTADTIRGLDVEQIGLTPENSLLDATFANLLGPLLALPKAKESITKQFANCRTPDIDVDGDGLEAFCDSNLNDDDKSVDVCIDGDGTIIRDGDDGVAQCTQAMKNGKPRFVDGISVEMNFETSKIRAILPPK
jgi:hypothetical protein